MKIDTINSFVKVQGLDSLLTVKTFYLRYYSQNNKISSEGIVASAGECRFGKWIFYYPNGKIREEGNYSKVPNEINMSNCRIKEGIWNYYNSRGEIAKVEKYKNGVLVK